MRPTKGGVIAAVLACTMLGTGPGVGAGPASKVAEGNPSNGGVTVTGRITYVGTVPIVDPTPVERDRSFCGESMPDESLLVDQGSHGVASVVISLEGTPKGKSSPEDRSLVIENRTCRFLPRVSAVLAGSLLVINNTDPIMHNTHIRKKSRFGDNLVNVVQPHQGKVEKPLKEAGLLDVRCDAHPFMHAAIHVFAHPYFSITDPTGRFELTQVPPGKYKLKFWHETLGSKERTITVPSKGPVIIDWPVGPEA